MNIIKEYLPLNQYEQVEFAKKQIYLHHTAGNSNPHNTITDWATDERGKIGTAYVVGGGQHDGTIVEAFEPRYWAWHLGIKANVFTAVSLRYQVLDKISIGIEICNWGQLTERNGKYYNYVNRVVPKEEVCVLSRPHRGYLYYHKYTTKQIEATRELLIMLKDTFAIPIGYNESIWDINTEALRGTPGLYTHNSVRPDKVDVSPQPKLIEMLKTL